MSELERISEILPRLQAPPTDGTKPQPNRETWLEECHCACGVAFDGEVVVYYIAGKARELRPRECPACQARREAEEEKERQDHLDEARAQQRQAWRARSHIPAELLARSTFESFEVGRQEKAVRNCLRFAQGLNLDDTHGYRSLILYSPHPGAGKTHLMVAIANYAIDHWQGDSLWQVCPIRFEKGPGLVMRIRATYSIRQGDDQHEREEDIYNELRGVKLLLLDDVGKEKGSEFTRQLYWSVIDERVTHSLPVIMTCRLPLDSTALADLMGEDTVDRLYGMANGQVETLTGESYRKLHKTP